MESSTIAFETICSAGNALGIPKVVGMRRRLFQPASHGYTVTPVTVRSRLDALSYDLSISENRPLFRASALSVNAFGTLYSFRDLKGLTGGEKAITARIQY